MIPGLPFWIVITVCVGAGDCRDIVSDKAVPTESACLIEGIIFAASWGGEHDGWSIDQIRCTQEEPKEEQPA